MTQHRNRLSHTHSHTHTLSHTHSLSLTLSHFKCLKVKKATEKRQARLTERHPAEGPFTFGFGRAALAELEGDAVGAHGLLLVAGQQLLQAAEVPLGAAQVHLPARRPGDLTVLVIHDVVHLTQANTHRGRGRVHFDLTLFHQADDDCFSKAACAEPAFVFFYVPSRRRSESTC